MKIKISVLIIIIFVVCAVGQTKKSNTPKNYVQVAMTNDGATSELLPMPIGMSPNLSSAEISIKYFGPKSDGDISFILSLEGTKRRYSTRGSFGVKLFSDDLPLSKNKYRVIDSIDRDGENDELHFFITTEDLAWLATSNSVKIEIYNLDSEQKLDSVYLSQTGFNEFKRYAKSVLMIKSFSS